jgi:ribosomal-protein-alanine N-acetyltransferase
MAAFTAYPDPPLTDGHVLLRRWREGDGECVQAGKSLGRDEAIVWIRRQWERLEKGRGVSLAIGDATRDEAAGYVGFLIRPKLELGIVDSAGAPANGDVTTICFRPQPGTVGIGYWVVERARGRHHATRAVALLAAWGFTELGVARIEALVDPANIPSSRVVEGAGFRCEGRLRAYLESDGARSDAFVYSRLRSDAL